MAIDLNAIQNTINREKQEKQQRVDDFNKALDTYFTDKENTNKVVVGTEKTSAEAVINELDYLSTEEDFIQANAALNEWKENANELLTGANNEALTEATYESLLEKISNKQKLSDDYDTEYEKLLETQTSINKLKENADMGTFSEIDSVLKDYNEILDGMYTYIDRQGAVASEHQDNISAISKWLKQGKILESMDTDSDTKGIQTGSNYGETFNTYMDLALESWIAGDTVGSQESFSLARNSISAEERMKAKFNKELEEAKKNKLLGSTDPGTGGGRKGGYVQTNLTEPRLNLIKDEVNKKLLAEGTIGGEYVPDARLNQNDLELIELLSSGDIEAVSVLGDQEKMFYDITIDNQEEAIQQTFKTINTYFGSGAGKGLISDIDEKLTSGDFQIVNVQPASSEDGYYENEAVRDQLKEGLSDNILKTFKYLDSGFGGFIGGARNNLFDMFAGNYFDPNNDIQALIDGKMIDKSTGDVVPVVKGSAEYDMLMSNIIDLYLGDNREEARKMTQDNFGGNESQGFNMLLSMLKAYKALETMDYLSNQGSKYDIKKD